VKVRCKEVLEYLYRQKTENRMNGATLIELPNTEGINDLYHEGYITIARDARRKIKKVSISGKGIDWVKNNSAESSNTPKTLEDALLLAQPITVSITSDVISIKIRDEIYSHIKSFLDSSHYFTAVEEAYKVVRQKLKDIMGEEAAAAVFGENALNSKHWENVFGSTPQTGTPEADFMRGAGYIHLGVQYLRNEKSHTTATSLDKNLALHYISLASLAYDLISRIDSDTEQ